MVVNGAPKLPGYKLYSKYLPLSSAEQINSYRFVNRIWSRTVSRPLSVSALAWPFIVINRKLCSAEL